MKTEIINEMINGYKESFIFAEPATDHNGEYIENLDDYDFSPSFKGVTCSNQSLMFYQSLTT